MPNAWVQWMDAARPSSVARAICAAKTSACSSIGATRKPAIRGVVGADAVDNPAVEPNFPDPGLGVGGELGA